MSTRLETIIDALKESPRYFQDNKVKKRYYEICKEEYPDRRDQVTRFMDLFLKYRKELNRQ